MENLDKKCAWKCMGIEMIDECNKCIEYDIKCREYLPMKETEQERIQRIFKQLKLMFY